MKEILTRIGNSAAFLRLEDFMAEYGLYIAAFCLGMITVYALWLRRHPEDFYTREEETELDYTGTDDDTEEVIADGGQK